MIDKIDKTCIERPLHPIGDAGLLADLRLKLIETIGVVNELAEQVADLTTRQQAAANHIVEANRRDDQ